jgi:hypothetical protein
MEDLQRRIDELVKEIRGMGRQREFLEEEVRILRDRLEEQGMQLEQSLKKNEMLSKALDGAVKRLERKKKQSVARERALKNECRRNTVLGRIAEGAGRKKLCIDREMGELSGRYVVMSRFIQVLSEKFGFDSEIFNELLKASEGFDDPVIAAFLQGIEPEVSCSQ